MNCEDSLMSTITSEATTMKTNGQLAAGGGDGKFPKPVQSVNVLTQIKTTDIHSKKFMMEGSKSSDSWNISDENELDNHFPNRRFNLFVGTWNMQRCKVPPNIDDFILAGEQQSDVYVIGIQEAPSDIKNWQIRLQETLGPNHALAHSSSHGVLHISIFVKRHLIWHCSDFVECKITTRPISQIKTKGAIGISFRFFGSRFLFLNSHFHSGQTKTNERIEDYNKITQELKISSSGGSNGKSKHKSDIITRFDGVFWFGDLNFRISQPHQHLKDEIANSTYDISEMIKCDQLTCNMKRGKLFKDFSEAQITFLPTYKFAANSDSYDTSKKFRVPSYTDRILFRSRDPDTIDYLQYNSVPALRNSDHRPVYGIFSVKTKPNQLGTSREFCGKFNHQVYSEAAVRNKPSSSTTAASSSGNRTHSMVCAIL